MSEDADEVGATGEHWELVVEDMHATAENYRAAGWETVEVVPGAVHVVDADADPDGQGGFVLVVTDETFDTVVGAVEGRTFDSFEVFRAERGDRVYLVAAVEDEGETALFLPAAYDEAGHETLRALAEDGPIHTHVRPPEGDDRVTFTHENPDPFLPARNDGNGTGPDEGEDDEA